MHVCVCICLYICMYIHVHIETYVGMYMDERSMYVCMYACKMCEKVVGWRFRTTASMREKFSTRCYPFTSEYVYRCVVRTETDPTFRVRDTVVEWKTGWPDPDPISDPNWTPMVCPFGATLQCRSLKCGTSQCRKIIQIICLWCYP
jgi:hypothetical protein